MTTTERAQSRHLELLAKARRVKRCWCGRSITGDDVFCAEHDDGPAPS